MLLVKKKVIAMFSMIIILFQIVSPSIYSYATEETDKPTEEIEIMENEEITEDKNIEETDTNEEKQEDIEEVEDEITNDEETKETEDIENVEKLEEDNAEEDTTEQEEIIRDVEKTDDEEILENTESEELEIIESEENGIMLMSAGDIYVGNEAEFRNALAMQASVIHVRQSIDFTSPIYINYGVTIVDESDSNALRYGYNGANFFVVQNGGSLTLNGMVVDTNSTGATGMTAINIQSGGSVTFVNSSIVDRAD